MEIQQLAARGLTFGLHIVTASTRWADYRAAMRDVFGSKLELRLGDPLDSEVDRKVAALVPIGRPGRGLVPSKLHFLGALPRIDGDGDADTLGDGVDDLIDKMAAAWKGPAGPQAAPAAREGHARGDPRGRRAPPGCRSSHDPARHQREGARPGRPRRRRRAAHADLRRRPVGQERAAARVRPRGHAHAHAEGGADRPRRLPPLAARRGPRRVPAQLPHLRHPGHADAEGHRDLPRGPHPRPRRDARAAAQPVVVDRRGGLRGRRRLRPRRHPAVLAGRPRCSR